MLNCWSTEPHDRPTFTELKLTLCDMCSQSSPLSQHRQQHTQKTDSTHLDTDSTHMDTDSTHMDTDSNMSTSSSDGKSTFWFLILHCMIRFARIDCLM